MTGDTLLITILSIAVTVESIVIGVMRSENQRLQRDYDNMREAAKRAIGAAKETQAQYTMALRMRP